MVLSLAFILAFIGSAVALLIGILIFSEVSEAMALTLPTAIEESVQVTVENDNINLVQNVASSGGSVSDVFRSTLPLDVVTGETVQIARFLFASGEGTVGHITTTHLYDQSLNLLATSNQVTVPSLSGGNVFLANFTFNHLIVDSGVTEVFVALQYGDNTSGETKATINDFGESVFRDTGNTYPTPPDPFVNDFLQQSNIAMWTEIDKLTSGVGTLTPAQQKEVDTFNNALNIGFTVIGILPVALFFALFAIFSGRTE